jgi:hypothetical protein
LAMVTFKRCIASDARTLTQTRIGDLVPKIWI